MGTGIICAPAAAANHEEANKKKLPIRRNTLRKVSETRFSVFLTNFKPLGPGNRAILNTGAAHNAAGPNLSHSTNRSATGKSEKDKQHQQPEQDVAHNRRPSPCGHCEQNYPDKQAKNVPAGGSRRAASRTCEKPASGTGSRSTRSSRRSRSTTRSGARTSTTTVTARCRRRRRRTSRSGCPTTWTSRSAAPPWPSTRPGPR